MNAGEWLLTAGAVAGAVSAIALTWRLIGRPTVLWTQRQVHKFGQLFIVVLGEPARPDPDKPGKTLPAIPGIGEVVSTLNDRVESAIVGGVERARKAASVAEAHAADAAAHAQAAERHAEACAENLEIARLTVAEDHGRLEGIERAVVELRGRPLPRTAPGRAEG